MLALLLASYSGVSLCSVSVASACSQGLVVLKRMYGPLEGDRGDFVWIRDAPLVSAGEVIAASHA